MALLGEIGGGAAIARPVVDLQMQRVAEPGRASARSTGGQRADAGVEHEQRAAAVAAECRTRFRATTASNVAADRLVLPA